MRRLFLRNIGRTTIQPEFNDARVRHFFSAHLTTTQHQSKQLCRTKIRFKFQQKFQVLHFLCQAPGRPQLSLILYLLKHIFFSLASKVRHFYFLTLFSVQASRKIFFCLGHICPLNCKVQSSYHKVRHGFKLICILKKAFMEPIRTPVVLFSYGECTLQFCMIVCAFQKT